MGDTYVYVNGKFFDRVSNSPKVVAASLSRGRKRCTVERVRRARAFKGERRAYLRCVTTKRGRNRS